MKRIIGIGVALVLLLSGELAAQMVVRIVDTGASEKAESIDEILLLVQYQLRFIPDTDKPDQVVDETMMLQIGDKASLYYSYTRFVADSLFMDALKKDDGNSNMQEKAGNQGLVTHKIYKNYPSGKVTTLDQVAATRFRCEEISERPEWQLLPDTAMIVGYRCQKAIATFKGREWEAWFTTEIPRSEGPWKLYGLPGLILKATDSQAHYQFECTGLVNGEKKPLLYGADGYEPVSRKNLNRVYERFAADPVGYVTSTSPNVKLTVRNEDGDVTKPKNTPYNPIELAR